jgi:ElaB/YqjD/DUF883 family membrane-anchored ribosome-binding protein
MPNSIANEIAENVEDTLDVVARSLREASERTQDLSEEASEVLSNAAADVVRVAEKLRKHAVDAARDVARQATHEVQQHPIASLAAALTAVAALVGVIAATRNSKSAPK